MQFLRRAILRPRQTPTRESRSLRSGYLSRRRLHQPSHIHVKQLLRNVELDEEDARVELRWMTEEARRIIREQTRPEGAEELDTVVRNMVDRRSKGEPLQYILGTVDFGPLDLLCRPPTLIPRPETADISSRFANLLPSTPLKGLDLCTGSGCIPMLLAHTRPELSMTGIDISTQAIDLARDNAKRCNLSHRVDVRMANVMTAVSGRYDVITSNPPYITTAEYDTLPISVKDYEDPRALLGSLDEADDGLTFYRRIAHMLPDLLNPGPADWPCVMLEIGAGQGEAVKDIMKTVPCLDRAEIWDDAYGKPRAVVAWRRA